MTPEELKDKKKHFKKEMSSYKNVGRITECFYHDKLACKGAIKQSHSLQRNGRLSLIEGNVNGNQMIYTFTETEIDEFSAHKSLIPIGKSSASTFFGFCDHHDSLLFSTIETKPFDGSDEHCFLHSYRSFAHSYHKKKEQLKAYVSKSDFTKRINPSFMASLIASNELAVQEGEVQKNKIDALMQNSDFGGLDYLIYTLPEVFPIACSSQIMPAYSYKNKPINNHNDPSIPFSPLMLTVLPDHSQTIIILACFPDDEKALILFNELDNLYPLKFQKAISSLLISCAENTFFSPSMWNAMGSIGQKQLCLELQKSADLNYNPPFFEHSKINFFDNKYSSSRLAI